MRYAIIILFMCSATSTTSNYTVDISLMEHVEQITPHTYEEICVLFTNDLPNYRQYVTSVVYAESSGEYVGDMDGQKAILDAVRYRSWDDYHPCDAYSVVTQPGQFDGKWKKGWKYKNTDRWRQIDELVCEWMVDQDTIYILPEGFKWFHNPITATDKEWVRSRNTRKQIRIGNHVFTN